MTPTNDEAMLVADTVRVSRDLGQDPFLVLHGGGNTSVKLGKRIRVKASGFDLGDLSEEGLVRVDRSALTKLLSQPTLSDTQMVEGYQEALVTPGDPSPTIETLVHHALPFTSVLHSHADAIVALTDTLDGENLVQRALGEEVIYLPYVMPGFDLARQILTAWEARSSERPTVLVLAHHGLFTCGDSPREAYDRHLDMVGRAVSFVKNQTGIDLVQDLPAPTHAPVGGRLDLLSEALTDYATGPCSVVSHRDHEVDAFIARDDFGTISQQGPTTLEHIIRTKRLPMVDGDIGAYIDSYRDYYERCKHRAVGETQMLDPLPRVILDPDLGLVTTGLDQKAARAVQDIYRHTVRIITATEALGGYRTIDEGRAFDIEYWELEQRRLRPAS
ncbi:class II aldolase/adducin family protein [Ornithinimicrobium faecis]|uniref:Class II aldolase/adducin family protein n=1 Tax=Ornithinimicrobium faecis TaxID=2934158 RepID=A0ABY4YZK5_9MICO|nr:class II aldolase/adducin family protein [Ornithinimicrobium sp. HY1793]USQ82228.1 class II aldolase/adducin family protein [Ornithinimicrobium sp. HY1793]